MSLAETIKPPYLGTACPSCAAKCSNHGPDGRCPACDCIPLPSGKCGWCGTKVAEKEVKEVEAA